MTYKDTIDFLFSQLAMYQQQGPSAYKPGLGTTLALDRAFGNPSEGLRVIHVAGTNGKGSTSHSLASVFQAAGLKTGLFTSPHLLDFRERIRIDGRMIPEEAVTEFVDRYKAMMLEMRPSFFELTTIMAFDWFARNGVDVAVVEVGLGGRLDSTNIVNPVMSVITNISLDHTALLGSTPEQIAGEKAGIIKASVPAVVGEAEDGVKEVFLCKAKEVGAPLVFASDDGRLPHSGYEYTENGILYFATPFGDLSCDLSGSCQPANMATVLTTLDLLRRGGLIELSDAAVAEGLADVAGHTGLMGRWMTVGSAPRVICDTGHNIGGWEYIVPRLNSMPGKKKIVVGFVNDKDIRAVLGLAATISEATFYFTRASVDRALPADQLAMIAAESGLSGNSYPTVEAAFMAAKKDAGADDTIFVGGSTFVVADLLALVTPAKG